MREGKRIIIYLVPQDAANLVLVRLFRFFGGIVIGRNVPKKNTKEFEKLGSKCDCVSIFLVRADLDNPCQGGPCQVRGKKLRCAVFIRNK